MLNDGALTVNPATGRVKVATSGALVAFGGGSPVLATGELSCRATPAVNYLAGLGYDASGNLCVSDGGAPDAWVAGLATQGGRLCVSGGNAIAGYVAGLPVDSAGRLCVEGLADADVTAWVTAVTANGGTLSANTRAAVDTFTKAAKAAGYWSKLKRLNLFCGNEAVACVVPLKTGGGSSNDALTGFVLADYSEATGLTATGGSKYVQTGFPPSLLTAGSTHMAFYVRSAIAGGLAVQMGASVNTDTSRFVMGVNGAGSLGSDMYDWADERASASVFAPGFMGGTRTDATTHRVFRNTSYLGTNNSTAYTSTLPAIQCYVFAINDNNTPGNVGAATLAMYSIGDGLTAADVSAYGTDIQAFQTALGRAV